jgi:hypothetical protein
MEIRHYGYDLFSASRQHALSRLRIRNRDLESSSFLPMDTGSGFGIRDGKNPDPG